MRAQTEQWLTRIWYGDRPAPLWLKALVPLYRGANRLDRWWQHRRQPDDLAAAYIVVVGNLSVGGSGKTPLVIRLCQLLRQAGLRPGVISRGYGRREKGLRLASPVSSPDVVGDEPLLIAQRAGVPVIVARDRCEAARTLLRKQINVIVSDDGLQHYRLPRDLEICVIDGNRAFGNGRLLPAGPLREPPQRLQSVDYVVVNGAGTGQTLPDKQDLIPMTFAAGLLRSLDGSQSWRLSQFKGCSVNAVAGIGNPQRFFTTLEQAGIKVIAHVFPDHHAFRMDDFNVMDSSFPILMTEKDFVKCRTLDLNNAWYLSVDAVLPAEWEQEVIRRVLAGPEREEQEA
jgi:tetraacyldisaccharide 4'-kinase